MKHLFLMRHAKAAPAEAGMADRDRQLAERGWRDSAAIGAEIARDGVPDLILCSPSKRTRETLDGVAGARPKALASEFPEALYGGGEAAYLDALGAHGGDARSILVIGHNPTVHALAIALAKDAPAEMRSKFPTAALAILAFDIGDWAGIRPGSGRLVRYLRPKDLAPGHPDD